MTTLAHGAPVSGHFVSGGHGQLRPPDAEGSHGRHLCDSSAQNNGQDALHATRPGRRVSVVSGALSGSVQRC